MSKIAFFISNHGYGHIMRNVPVINELLSRGHEVVVVTGEPQSRIAGTQTEAQFIVCDTDAGMIVKPGSLIVDQEATKRRVAEHVGHWSEFIDMAKGLHADAIVADIVPWALIAASESKVPAYFMVSFTWIEQYEGFLDEGLLKKYVDAYQLPHKNLYYDLANTACREMLGEGRQVGFVARPFDLEEVSRIRKQHSRPIVFISLGASNSGLETEIDVSGLPYDFIATRALKLKGDNVEYLDESVQNTHDYVKAADFCITKAGWSTVSEIMISGLPFAAIERDDAPEDSMTITQLKERNAAISIKADDLQDMGKVMDRLTHHEFSVRSYPNGAKNIADIICCEKI